MQLRKVLRHYLDGEKQSEIAKSLGKETKTIDNTLQKIKSVGKPHYFQ